MHLSSVSLLRLVILFFAPVAVETAVRGCVEDRDKDHRPRMNCTSAGYRDVPSGIEPSTKVLLFPQNQFSDLSWTSFTVFTEIHEIDLSRNQVSTLTSSDAPILPSLAVLRLGSNQLRSLTDHCFSGSPALTELYLQNNLISSLQDQSFSVLSKLEILDLSNNHIQTLPPLMMHPLKAIETLYLEGNKIKVMPDNWFSQKEEVPYLYLSANPWACSCSLGYLHRYLDAYEFNIYVKDGPIIMVDVDSVICDSPQSLKGQSVVKLEESDFCNPMSPTEQSHFLDTTISPPLPPLYYYHHITTTKPTTTTTKPTTTTTTTAATATTADPTTPVDKYWTHSYYKVVTWYETYTRSVDRSDIWGSLRGDGQSVKKMTVPPTTELPTTTSTAFPTTTPQTSPVLTTSTAFPMTTPQTSPVLTTSTAFPTTTPQTSPVLTTSTAFPTTTPILTTFSTVNPTEIQQTTLFTPETFRMPSTEAVYEVNMIYSNGSSDKVSSVEARVVFCFWLFVSCIFLCVISAFSSLITAFRLYFWYRGVYKSLKCIIAGKEQVRMLSYCRNIDKKVKYQTMLFVSKDVKQSECFVNLGPKTWTEEAQNIEKVMYKEAVYQEISKEEEIEAKDVLAECTASREANPGMSKKRYSVILREEGEKDGGEMEKCDWVVGGWEVEKGAEPGSSWGEWLVQNLPSMPWRVSAPPKSEAESLECCVNEKDE